MRRWFIATCIGVTCLAAALATPSPLAATTKHKVTPEAKGRETKSTKGGKKVGTLTWSSPTMVLQGGVACAGRSFCVAVAHQGATARQFNGKVWAAPQTIDSNNDLSAVSCANPKFCVAVDAAGGAVTFNGSSWSGPAVAYPNGDLVGVSCASSEFCAALNATGGAVTYSGTAWSAPMAFGSGESFTAISCASSTFCVAADDAGEVTTYNGSAWSAPQSVDTDAGSNGVAGISSASTSLCVMVDSNSNSLTYNGNAWSAPKNRDHTRAGLYGVSCAPGSSFCVALDQESVMTDSDGSWSAAPKFPGPEDFAQQSLEQVSCSTSTFCVAIDANGNAYTGT